ncbi:MAG TPA: hypothetical protein VM222_05265 [Planctomycetota bacterium]|nr:hypothetical protein [Planctomycetota bacterium]
MSRSTLFALRLALFAALVWIGSACGGDRFVGAPLLTEGFDGAFPGANWTAPSTSGAGVAPTLVGAGNPAPALQFTIPSATGTASTTTTASFNNPNLTIAVQEAVTSTPAGLSGASTIAILDSTPAVVATATWDNVSGQVSFAIGATPAGATTLLASDGTFHTFKFNVDASGNATWALDGATKQTLPGFTAGLLKVRLSAVFGAGTSWPNFLFDNLSVTSP